MKRLWQRHMLIRIADKDRRTNRALEAMGGMMGGIFQGMIGASLANSMNSPEMINKLKEIKEKRRKH